MTDELPALLGGPPTIPGGPPRRRPDPSAADALRAALDAGRWADYRADALPALETELANAFGCHAALACSSGTLAVEVALRALRVGPGHEVILSAYEYEPTFLTLHALGATPVLVDADPNTGGVIPEAVADAITERTRAVVATHLHGGLVPMPRLLEAVGGRVPVVEDAAQACGATVAGRAAGSWGDFGTLSFGGSKLLTAGRGGAVLCANARRAQQARLCLTRGVQQWAALSELQAIALRPQLASLAGATAERLAAVREFEALLHESGVPGLTRFTNEAADVPAFYKVGLLYDPAAWGGLSRVVLCAALRAEGVALDPGFRALHVGRSTSRFVAWGTLAGAEILHARTVTLHHPVLAGPTSQREAAVRAIGKAYRNADRLLTLRE